MFTVEEIIFICLMLLFLSCHMLISLPRVIFYPSNLVSSLILRSQGSLWCWETYYRIPTTQGISSVLRWLLVPLPSRIESSHNNYRRKNKERKGPHWAPTLVLSMALPVMIVVVIDIDTVIALKIVFLIIKSMAKTLSHPVKIKASKRKMATMTIISASDLVSPQCCSASICLPTELISHWLLGLTQRSRALISNS